MAKKIVHPEGYYTGLGIAFGIPIGAGFGMAIGNMAIGPAIGIAIGVAIGAGMEEKAKKEGRVRSLTKLERKRRKKILWGLLAAGVLMFVVGVVAFFLVR